MNTVLFACVRNAGRSQIAAAWFNEMADRGRARAISAGSRPADRVHPEVLKVLGILGLDHHVEVPRLLTPELARGATLLVTMGCGEACPAVPGLEIVEWVIPDPHERPQQEVEAIASEIRSRVAGLLRERGWGRPDSV